MFERKLADFQSVNQGLGKVALLASVAFGYLVAYLVIVFVFGADIGTPALSLLYGLVPAVIGVMASTVLSRRG